MILLSICKPGIGARYAFDDPRIIDTEYVGQAAISYLQEHCNGRRIIIFTHGYNSDRTGAIESYRIIEQKLKDRGLLGPLGRYDDAVGLLWPSSFSAGYWIAEGRATQAGGKLFDIFEQLKCASISIETHSLGARVAMGFLSKGVNLISDLILTAPAIDYESLECGTVWGDKVRVMVGKALVCYSTQDQVLSQIYRGFGSLARHPWPPFKGDSALGCVGPSDPAKLPGNVALCDGSAYIPDHSAWRSADQFYERWSKL